tara:strand:- start:6347 stop:7348 length:1002 start_codon:yes stop_codon:yes gene_type:complete
MAENASISAMAEELSIELFHYFYWGKIGEDNHDWPCENKEAHKAATHPCDAVFYYDEPYDQKRTYLHTDLKSYGKGSIDKSSIETALISLANQVSCANISSHWSEKHRHGHVPYKVHGLLFIYNHDELYDKDFSHLLSNIDINKLALPSKTKIFVLGPEEINWLQIVMNNIKNMRGSSRGFRLPLYENCFFNYPQLARKPNIKLASAKAATVEMLVGPWITLEYKEETRSGIVIFYKRQGTTEEEFIYLLDHLRHYQLLGEEKDIKVYFQTKHHPIAIVNFQKARQRYLEELEVNGIQNSLGIRVSKIETGKLEQIITSYSQTELGMRYEQSV